MNAQRFKLVSKFQPTGDQPTAIQQLVHNLKLNQKDQVLLGVTGSGKTFTMANVIEHYQRPTLVIAHNKTLAMQLYLELKNFFPNNRVEYYVSNFDYYQPEAYLPGKDLYIDKDVKHNIELDMMRLSATNSLVTHRDTIVVASVAAIFAAQDPQSYQSNFFEIRVNQKISRATILNYLVHSGYQRNNLDLQPGQFAARGDVLKIAPSHSNLAYIRVELFGNEVEAIALVDPINHTVNKKVPSVTIFPAQSYVMKRDRLKKSIARIKSELKTCLIKLSADGKLIEYNRLKQRTENDIQDLEEYGFCSGIENYSLHLSLRNPQDQPTTLLDYFGQKFLTIIDESHITLPQIKGMFNTNVSRKQTLIKYGFRLPSALENRPLNAAEFYQSLVKVIYTSATPADHELALAKGYIVEQIIRPTGLLDPQIHVKPVIGQINTIISEIKARSQRHEKVIITTLTKRMSEELTSYLQQFNLKVTYLHSDLKTLERTIIINDLRKGVYDCLVGVNLLREGIDIPEVSLICILDADKQGFLRNTRSLIQIMGRAARHVRGEVFLFADRVSPAMQQAIEETQRRRVIQQAYNDKHHIIPHSIHKPIFEHGVSSQTLQAIADRIKGSGKRKTLDQGAKAGLIKDLERDMLRASKNLNFEKAAQLRDIIIEIRGS